MTSRTFADSGPLPAVQLAGTGHALRVSWTDWPLRAEMSLGLLDTSVGVARDEVRLTLAEWGMSQLIDSAAVVVSELVTNALNESAGIVGYKYRGRWVDSIPPISVWVFGDLKRIIIRVWDAGFDVPRIGAPQALDEAGRGLLLVEALSSTWGYYQPAWASGKVVWAVIDSP
jgi:anti-sigma regulatory factor (Ser/Thr protein kinase)